MYSTSFVDSDYSTIMLAGSMFTTGKGSIAVTFAIMVPTVSRVLVRFGMARRRA
jgi:hypothetical protein